MCSLGQIQQRKIEELEHSLADTRRHLRDKEEDARNVREKMSHLKAHLGLIAESLDQNHVSRKMLVNVLAQI